MPLPPGAQPQQPQQQQQQVWQDKRGAANQLFGAAFTPAPGQMHDRGRWVAQRQQHRPPPRRPCRRPAPPPCCTDPPPLPACLCSWGAQVRRGARYSAQRMSADEIEHIMRIMYASLHSGHPYAEDFYCQAHTHKYSGGRALR
jgi:hypothetical protein